MSQKGEKPLAVYGALAANVAIAVTKLIAAAVSGSSAMLSEGIHSVVDSGNELLLLHGMKRAARPADDAHPYGHGKELYFWSLIVAILLFGMGGGMSIYEGITHLEDPHWLEKPTWNYVVLGAAFLFEGTSWVVAMRQFRRQKSEGPLLGALHASKDPSVFTVLAEDTAALAGLVVAFVGVFLNHQFHMVMADGIASLVIGVILAVAALALVYESHGLLVGEAADPEVVRSVRRIVENDPDVERAGRPLTMHFGPENVLLSLDVRFKATLSTIEVARAVDRIERQIRAAHPAITRIFLEVRSLSEKRPEPQPTSA